MIGWRWLLAAGVAAGIAGCGGSASNQGGGTGDTGTQVTFQFTGAIPAAVATKIGSGAFTTVTPAATVTFEVPIGTTDFSVAYVCPEVSLTVGLNTVESNSERILDATIADGTSYTELCATSTPSGTTGTLTANVGTNALGATNIQLQASNGNATANVFLSGAAANVSMTAPAGNDWVGVLAYRYPIPSDTVTSPPTLVGAKFFENQAVPGALNGGELVVLTAADATTPEPLTFSNVPAGYDTPFAQVSFIPAGQKTSVLMTTGATASYPAMPTAVAQSGDTYQVVALANSSAGSSSLSTGLGEQVVGVQQTLTAPGPVSISFPAPWGYAGPDSAALPSFDFSYAGFSGASKVSRTGTITWSTGSQVQASIGVTATAAYGGGAAFVSIPDLSELNGFIAKPSSGAMVTWVAAVESGASVASSGSSGATGSAQVELVESMGTFVVP